MIIVSDADLQWLNLAVINDHTLIKGDLQELSHNIITAFLVLKTHVSTTITPDRLILCKRVVGRVKIAMRTRLTCHIGCHSEGNTDTCGYILFESVLQDIIAVTIVDQQTVKSF